MLVLQSCILLILRNDNLHHYLILMFFWYVINYGNDLNLQKCSKNVCMYFMCSFGYGLDPHVYIMFVT